MQLKSYSLPLTTILSILALPLLLTVGCASNGVDTESNNRSLADNTTPSEFVATENSAVTESANDEDKTVMPETETDNTELSENKQTDVENQNQTAMKTVVDSDIPGNGVLHFKFDKSEVSDNDLMILKQHAEYLAAHPKFILSIDGHADNRGSKHYNDRLSQARAQTVSSILVSFGAPESQLLINTYGATKPVEDNKHWQQNRRVELSYSELYMVSK